LTGTWGVDGRVTDPDSVLDTDTPSAFLDSFAGVDPNGSWTLFVADMSMNGVGEIKSWGLDISATVPEPAALSILLLGIVLLWGFHRVKKNSYSQVTKR
jgi:hypothetical protein